MPSNPIGPDTKNLTVNVPSTLHAELTRLAGASGKKLGAYVRKVLEETVQHRVIYREVRETYQNESPDATLLVAENPPGKKRWGKSR